MNTIDSSNATRAGSLQRQADFDSSQAQTGTLLGNRAVVVSDELSSLNDSAEELSLHMAEKTEQKHHSERKVKGDRPIELMQLEEIVESLENGKEEDAQAKLDDLVEELLANKAPPRQAASKTFGDVTEQYLGLQYALRKGADGHAPAEVMESIRDALHDLELESGPQVRAGLNALGSAAAFAPDARGVKAFLTAYRDVVLGESSLGKTLNMALETFGGTHIARGLKQLIAALGQDIAATRPSTDPARLRALTHDLYQLQIAVTVLEGSGDLAATLANKKLARVDPDRLMSDLVGVTGESWVSEARFTSMARQHGADCAEGRVAFLGGTKGLLRELPIPVFSSAEARQGHLDALQEALDSAIDEEEQL